MVELCPGCVFCPFGGDIFRASKYETEKGEHVGIWAQMLSTWQFFSQQHNLHNKYSLYGIIVTLILIFTCGMFLRYCIKLVVNGLSLLNELAKMVSDAELFYCVYLFICLTKLNK